MGLTCGRYEDRLPYYRFGEGTDDLVVLPGLEDVFWSGTPDPVTGRLLARRFDAYTDAYTVHVVSRPRNLAEDSTTRTMAGAAATYVDELGPSAVVGLSMGGMIAQYLAVDYPELVDSLVLGASGVRLGERGRAVVERWQRLAAAESWGELAADSADVSYAGPRRLVYGSLGRVLAGTGVRAPAAPADAAISCRTVLDHDATDHLPDVAAPALVLGGSADALFPESVLRETARLLPAGHLALVDGAGHGVVDSHAGRFHATVRSFLDD